MVLPCHPYPGAKLWVQIMEKNKVVTFLPDLERKHDQRLEIQKIHIYSRLEDIKANIKERTKRIIGT